MNKWIGPVVGGLALIVGIVNLVALQSVSSRVDELAHSQLAMAQEPVEPVRVSRGDRGRDGRRERRRDRRDERVAGEGQRAPSAALSGVDLQDPVVVEELTAVLAERMEERELSEREVRHQTFMDEASEEVRRFAEERDWADDTTDEVVGEVQARMDAWHSLRQDMHEGAVSRFDGRREMETLREDSDTKLLSLMSQDDFDALNESVLPGRGRGGRGRR